MKKNYLIGVGGTGARVIEAAIFLCSAGYGPDNLTVFMIDPDEGNGNLTRTKSLLALYETCRKSYQRSQNSGLFKTQIDFPDPFVWNIFKEKNVSLKDFINLRTYEQTNPELADFIKVLFSPLELTTTLNEGFRGHPSIGAVVMSDPPLEEHPWRMLWEDIADAKAHEVRVFFVGSIFGGTGAAGVPTFGSREMIKYNLNAKIKDDISRVLLGGALVLPYFSFEVPAGVVESQQKKMFVTRADFPVATKAALQYYNEKSLGFDQLYFIGDYLSQKVGDFSPGAGTQENLPHYMEILNSLAASDFFAQPEVDGKPDKLYFTSCREGDAISWAGLPVTREADQIAITHLQEEVKSRLTIMTAFAYALNTYGHAIMKKAHREVDDTWYSEHFDFKEKEEQDKKKDPRFVDNKNLVENIEKFSRHFLKWICAIDDLTGSVKMIDRYKLVVDGTIEAKKDIVLYPYDQHKNNIGAFLKDEKSKNMDFDDFIAQGLNEIQLEDKAMMAGSKFVNIFYEGARVFCNKNYNIII